jgi:hypothetical protein
MKWHEVNYPDAITDENGITHENKYVLVLRLILWIEVLIELSFSPK